MAYAMGHILSQTSTDEVGSTFELCGHGAQRCCAPTLAKALQAKLACYSKIHASACRRRIKRRTDKIRALQIALYELR
jgi:hypothetical protein